MPQTLDNIDLGQYINVNVVRKPTNAAASKTLTRILAKDPEHQREDRRLRKVRKKNAPMSTRGGRWRVWEGRLGKQPIVTGDPGDQGNVRLTQDVLNDLRSVEPFIEVQPR